MGGWKPESGGFSSTDTPDFFYEDDDERGDINNKIGFTDGIMGSTGLDKLKEQNTGGNNPGVEGALDVDPDVIGGYTCATAEAAGVKFELTTLAKMGRFDQEVSIDMPAASDIPRLRRSRSSPSAWASRTSTPTGRRRRRPGSPFLPFKGGWKVGAASRPCSISKSPPTARRARRSATSASSCPTTTSSSRSR